MESAKKTRVWVEVTVAWVGEGLFNVKHSAIMVPIWLDESILNSPESLKEWIREIIEREGDHLYSEAVKKLTREKLVQKVDINYTCVQLHNGVRVNYRPASISLREEGKPPTINSLLEKINHQGLDKYVWKKQTRLGLITN